MHCAKSSNPVYTITVLSYCTNYCIWKCIVQCETVIAITQTSPVAFQNIHWPMRMTSFKMTQLLSPDRQRENDPWYRMMTSMCTLNRLQLHHCRADDKRPINHLRRCSRSNYMYVYEDEWQSRGTSASIDTPMTKSNELLWYSDACVTN